MQPIVITIHTTSGLRAALGVIFPPYGGVATHGHEYLWVRHLYAKTGENGYLGLGKKE
jgi:hypothetical protein